MSHIPNNQDLAFAVATAQEAGTILLKHFGTALTKKIKTGPNDYSTEADIAAEAYILGELKKAYPQDTVVAEESGQHKAANAEYTWIVDPLDGTHNFANGSTDFGVMLTRAHGETLELAVVWNPAKKLLAAGTRGGGVWLNDKQVKLNQLSLNNKPLSVEQDNQEQVRSGGHSTTNLGASANTLMTLAGERRAFVSSNGFVWDFAPAALLLKEAGWKVTNFAGQTFVWDGRIERGHPGIIAAEPTLHAKLLELLK